MSVICPKNYGSCGVSIQYNPNRLFVLMPFSEKVAPQNLFFEVLKKLPGWGVHRADSDLSKPEIWCKICANIQSSRAVIVDLSGSNPNVFLELGLSWGLGRPFILLAQDIKNLPFDTMSFHVIRYVRNNSGVIDSGKIRDDILEALDAIPMIAPVGASDSPEAFLIDRITEAKKRTIQHWHKSNDGWQIVGNMPIVQKIGISLLKDYPQAKSIDLLSFETNSREATIRDYLSSKTRGYSRYFSMDQEMIRLSNDGVYWLLDTL